MLQGHPNRVQALFPGHPCTHWNNTPNPKKLHVSQQEKNTWQKFLNSIKGEMCLPLICSYSISPLRCWTKERGSKIDQKVYQKKRRKNQSNSQNVSLGAVKKWFQHLGNWNKLEIRHGKKKQRKQRKQRIPRDDLWNLRFKKEMGERKTDEINPIKTMRIGGVTSKWDGRLRNRNATTWFDGIDEDWRDLCRRLFRWWHLICFLHSPGLWEMRGMPVRSAEWILYIDKNLSISHDVAFLFHIRVFQGKQNLSLKR